MEQRSAAHRAVLLRSCQRSVQCTQVSGAAITLDEVIEVHAGQWSRDQLCTVENTPGSEGKGSL